MSRFTGRARGVLAVVALLWPACAGAETFVVDTRYAWLPDVDPGDGTCETEEGTCSLAAAIQETNDLAGPDTILVPGGRHDLPPTRVEDDLTLLGDWGASISGDLAFRIGRAEIAGIALEAWVTSAAERLVVRDCTLSGALSATNGRLEVVDAIALAGFFPAIRADGSEVVLERVRASATLVGGVEPSVKVIGGSLTLRDCLIVGTSFGPSEPQAYGRGVRVEGGSVVVEGTTFTKLGHGPPALSVSGGSDVRIVDSRLVGNSTLGLDVSAESVTLSRCEIRGNSSYPLGRTGRVSGGGARIAATDVLVENSSFVGNSISWNWSDGAEGGAGLHLRAERALLRGCAFERNTARSSTSDDGISWYETDIRGGALFVDGSVVLDACSFVGNSGRRGGGAHIFAGELVLVNTTFSDNRGDVAELEVAGGRTRLIHATIRHADGEDLAPVLVAPGAELRARDTVLAGGLPSSCEGTLTSEGGVVIEHGATCDVQGDPTGVLIGANPLLGPLRSLGISSAHDPVAGSPLLDAAVACADAADQPLDRDQRGDVRPVDADSDGIATCDVGAIEACRDSADRDSDGVGDACDLCPDVADSAQGDQDDDGIGDVCDPEEPSALDRDPGVQPLTVVQAAAGVTIEWETTDDGEWDLLSGSLVRLHELGLPDAVERTERQLATRVTVEHDGSQFYLVRGRVGDVVSSSGRDSFGTERVP